MIRRQITEKIPEHLQPFIAKQDPSLYTAIDHASWRFILKISQAFFAKNAHQKYLDGLKETGISTDRIPLISEMDQKLRRFGWRAVPVSGFIPPAAFMEFQSLGVLPIACEMRTLEHLAYTPAPDIVHEAAGHAPIIADQQYADYLRSYGEVSRKAIFSDRDMAVYEGIRELSDIKEDPKSTQADIDASQKRLDDALAAVEYVSEATLLSRMNWWTVEYGLVGSFENPKIYGAGLLSSVGESYHCLGPNVRKIPLTSGCIEISYDITKPQPQLFVTPDFPALEKILEEFATTMAFRKGGVEGLDKAKRARTLTTTQFDSGIQMSGKLEKYLIDSRGNPIFVKFQGPTQLAFEDQEIENQGAKYHREGFSTPVGRLKNGKSPADLTADELGLGHIEFESGIVVQGSLKSTTQRKGRNVILSFESCTVTLGKETLFMPDWGIFDMACGEKVVSVFGGAADRRRYLAATGGYKQKPRIPKTNLTDANLELNELYSQVRELRESGDQNTAPGTLAKTVEALDRKYPDDWLLRYELLELNSQWKLQAPWEGKVRDSLARISALSQDRREMISRGLALL
jgi:phenylalanine-4-hydroxylase